MSAHDSAMIRLCVELDRFVPEKGTRPWFYEVGLNRVKLLIPDAPEGFVVPDFMFFAGEYSEHIPDIDAPVKSVPTLIIEVVERASLEADFYLKPEWYLAAGVREYCVYDPCEEVLLPYFQGWRLRDGVYRRMPTTSSGEFFSVLGFSLSLLFHGPVIVSCGPAELEEELAECEWLLDKARERIGSEQKKLDELTVKAERLRTLLAGHRG